MKLKTIICSSWFDNMYDVRCIQNYQVGKCDVSEQKAFNVLYLFTKSCIFLLEHFLFFCEGIWKGEKYHVFCRTTTYSSASWSPNNSGKSTQAYLMRLSYLPWTNRDSFVLNPCPKNVNAKHALYSRHFHHLNRNSNYIVLNMFMCELLSVSLFKHSRNVSW